MIPISLSCFINVFCQTGTTTGVVVVWLVCFDLDLDGVHLLCCF